jgi:glycosyltransferase involved in cell wall biosynthesis
MSAPGSHAALPLTVVIAARNEAANIAGCIDSVRWAQEIIVAENGSSDDTAQIAQQSGALVMRDGAPTIGGQRNAAIAHASHPWILVLDADERAPASFRASVAHALAQPQYDAYRVPRRNIFLRKEICHGGWAHDRPIRLFRSTLRYDDRQVHERVQVTSPVGVVPDALMHYPYVSLNQYFEKFERYSRWWAEQQYARGKRVGALGVLLRPPARFFKMYVLQRGFLDGIHGLVLALLAAMSVLAKYVRLWGKQFD